MRGIVWRSHVLAAFVVVSALAATKSSTPRSYGNIPLTFEENCGQIADKVPFIAHGPGYLMLFGNDRVSFQLRNRHGQSSNVQMRWLAGAARPHIKGTIPVETKTNYLIGTDSSKWNTGIRNYAAIEYKEIYSGIDLLFYGNQRNLEYDLIVNPGADLSKIRFDMQGFQHITVNEAGDLVLSTSAGDLIQRKPVVYQERNGHRRTIEASYRLLGRAQIGIAVGAHDKKSRLVIDPVLAYSTYLGGAGDDMANAVAVDSAGNAYITGSTGSPNFPVQNSFQSTNAGGSADVFVAKVNPAGTALIYSTFLGGSDDESGLGIAVSSSGNAYVTGTTRSANFPTTPGAFQRQKGSPYNPRNAFVAELDAGGSTLVFSTYLGGDGPDSGKAIAVDSSGNIYVAGSAGTHFPTTPGAFQPASFSSGAFLTKLRPDGNALLFSTYFTGTIGGMMTITGLAIDSANAPYLTGYTAGADLPTTPGAFQRNALSKYPVPTNAFVTKFQTDGTALTYSTYLGGSTQDYGRGIAIDTSGNAYVAGDTSSTDFPVTAAIAGSSFGNVFVSKLNASGSGLVYSTRFGSNGALIGPSGYSVSRVSGMALDPARNVIVVGSTGAADFPVTTGAIQTAVAFENTSVSDGFVSKLNASGTGLLYSTLLGSVLFAAPPETRAVATDAAGSAYIAGSSSGSFPATVNSLQPAINGGADSFIAKITDAVCNFSISPTASTIGVNGGIVPVSVTADPGCNWVTVSPAGWAKPVAGASGVGSGSVSLNVQANANIPRTDVVSIAGKTFTLSQQSNCTFNVVFTPASPPLTSAGGYAAHFTVSSPATCGATASSSAAWLQFGYTGSQGSVYGDFLASANFGPEARSATVTVVDQQFTITQPGGYVCAYTVTPLSVSVGVGGGAWGVAVSTVSECSWASTPNVPWITVVTPSQQTAAGSVAFNVAPNSGLTRVGTLTIAGQTVTVSQAGTPAAPPFGVIDTPVNGSSGQAGAINFTGWALSSATIAKVALCREPVTGEGNTTDPHCLLSSSPTGLVYLGNAVLVPGVRPDVAATFPGYPNNNWGWGAQILTNYLPATTGQQLGNGTYKLHAIAADPGGLSTDLGTTIISAANATSILPFGTLDTPGQGGIISGTNYVNFGWVVTPQPSIVAFDGSSIVVHVDGVAVGHPTYNQYRSDIATLFPGLKNSNGAVGFFVIDTTKLSNGIHNIDWVATDSAGHSGGIGSRNFFVSN